MTDEPNTVRPIDDAAAETLAAALQWEAAESAFDDAPGGSEVEGEAWDALEEARHLLRLRTAALRALLPPELEG